MNNPAANSSRNTGPQASQSQKMLPRCGVRVFPFSALLCVNHHESIRQSHCVRCSGTVSQPCGDPSIPSILLSQAAFSVTPRESVTLCQADFATQRTGGQVAKPEIRLMPQPVPPFWKPSGDQIGRRSFRNWQRCQQIDPAFSVAVFLPLVNANKPGMLLTSVFWVYTMSATLRIKSSTVPWHQTVLNSVPSIRQTDMTVHCIPSTLIDC